MNNTKKIFFLGGKDPEMETIQKLLLQNNIEFVNDDLSWSNAYIDNYVNQIKEKIREGYTVYGVELLNPNKICIDSDNFKIIDHHGALEGELSSLEQVCKIIEHDLTREEKLIAANDARYISGMRAIGASEEEITDIRQRDKKAQGVTEEERQAEIDISSKNPYGKKLIVVKTNLKHFSPIVDRLEYECLLVYSESEFTYYGKDKDYVKYRVENSKLCIKSTYYVGGDNGFYGGQFNNRDVELLISLCRPVISKHLFLFPFLNSDINLSTFHKPCWSPESGNWKRVSLDKNHLDPTLYNEMNYFYPHLHNILYDSADDSCIRHYEYLVSHKDKYIIQIKPRNEPRNEPRNARFELDVDSININFYSTGVAVLSIGVNNTEYDSPDDILKINQYGRRLFHPFANDISLHLEGAFSLVLKLSMERIELMNSDINVANAVSEGLTQYINSSISNQKNEISPILDDRMFVLSWYKNGKISLCDKEAENCFWYRYVFVDSDYPSCQNTEMRTRLLDSATYPRWQDYGTLYGISRYSFVMLTSPTCPCHMLQYFETEYVKIAELALVQRASILKYTKVLQERTNTKDEFRNTDDLSSCYEEYLHFLNNYRFTNISSQDQAIELYEMLCDKIHIKEDAGLLDQQFNEVQEFMELYEERAANKEAQILNRLAGWAVPIAIISAIFGFFFHDNFGLEKVSDFQFDITSLWTNPGFYGLYATIALMIILGIQFKKKQGK